MVARLPPNRHQRADASGKRVDWRRPDAQIRRPGEQWRAFSFLAATVFAAGRRASTSRIAATTSRSSTTCRAARSTSSSRSESLTPIRPISERLAAWRESTGREIRFEYLTVGENYHRLLTLIREEKPDVDRPLRRAARRALFDEIVMAQALHRQQQPERHQRRALRHRRIAARTSISCISARWGSMATAPPE